MTQQEIEIFLKFLRHDARIPLVNAYDVISSILDDDISKNELVKKIETAKKEIKRALDFNQSAVELFQKEPSITAVKIDQYIKKALAYNSHSADKKGIDVIFKGNGLIAKGNGFMLESIVRNLLSNAIKFTPIGGEVTIETNNRGGMIYISVRDNGSGIPDEIFNQEKLFSLSESKIRVGTNGEEGSGFGLFLCKEFVNKMGGIIQASRLNSPVFTFENTIQPNMYGAEIKNPDLEPAGTQFTFTVPEF